MLPLSFVSFEQSIISVTQMQAIISFSGNMWFRQFHMFQGNEGKLFFPVNVEITLLINKNFIFLKIRKPFSLWVQKTLYGLLMVYHFLKRFH